jgi:hypothetical protein
VQVLASRILELQVTKDVKLNAEAGECSTYCLVCVIFIDLELAERIKQDADIG